MHPSCFPSQRKGRLNTSLYFPNMRHTCVSCFSVIVASFINPLTRDCSSEVPGSDGSTPPTFRLVMGFFDAQALGVFVWTMCARLCALLVCYMF